MSDPEITVSLSCYQIAICIDLIDIIWVTVFKHQFHTCYECQPFSNIIGTIFVPSRFRLEYFAHFRIELTRHYSCIAHGIVIWVIVT